MLFMLLTYLSLTVNLTQTFTLDSIPDTSSQTSPLHNIEAKIKEAFRQSIQSKSEDALETISLDLDRIDSTSKSTLLIYWRLQTQKGVLSKKINNF